MGRSNDAERAVESESIAERHATTLAILGGIAIAVGIGGILLTDATLGAIDTPYPVLVAVGFGCYVYLKYRGVL